MLQVNMEAHPELAARFKIRVAPTLLIFAGGAPVEFSVGIIPEHYLFEMVRKALGGSTETLEPGERHPSSQWRRNSRRSFSLERRLRCPAP